MNQKEASKTNGVNIINSFSPGLSVCKFQALVSTSKIIFKAIKNTQLTMPPNGGEGSSTFNPVKSDNLKAGSFDLTGYLIFHKTLYIHVCNTCNRRTVAIATAFEQYIHYFGYLWVFLIHVSYFNFGNIASCKVPMFLTQTEKIDLLVQNGQHLP